MKKRKRKSSGEESELPWATRTVHYVKKRKTAASSWFGAKKGAAKKKVKKTLKKGAVAKKAARKKSAYNPQTGRPTGRAVGALERREKRVEELMSAHGLSKPEALAKANAEMRDNPTSDWRKG